MKKLIDRVHSIIRAHPEGISSPAIRVQLNTGKPHERCMVAHVLTQLYRAKMVQRDPMISNSAKTYLYRPPMNSINFIKNLIANNPGISSIEIRKQFASATGKNVDVASTVLTNLAKRGAVSRKEHLSDGNFKYFCYWLTGRKEVKPAIPEQERIAPNSRLHDVSGRTMSDGLEAAALICELQSKLKSGDPVYVAACQDCAKLIMQFSCAA